MLKFINCYIYWLHGKYCILQSSQKLVSGSDLDCIVVKKILFFFKNYKVDKVLFFKIIKYIHVRSKTVNLNRSVQNMHFFI